MNAYIKKILADFFYTHPKLTQWLWFIALWGFGLLSITVLTYPLRLLIGTLKK